MILTNPYTTLEGVDRKTGQPVVNITANDAPEDDGNKKVQCSLVFDTPKDLRIFGQLLIAVARGITTEQAQTDIGGETAKF